MIPPLLTPPLFPYTTLFRSRVCRPVRGGGGPGQARVPTVLAGAGVGDAGLCSPVRSEEHTSELQSRFDLVCRLLLEKKKRVLKSAATFTVFDPIIEISQCSV